MKKAELREYRDFERAEILELYQSVGWTAYTDHPETLASGFENSLDVIGAYIENKLAGIIRTVGDGQTIVYIQDILVLPQFQRLGIGTALIKAILDKYSSVRQIILATDNTEKTCEFYKSVGLTPFDELGLRAFTK